MLRIIAPRVTQFLSFVSEYSFNTVDGRRLINSRSDPAAGATAPVPQCDATRATPVFLTPKFRWQSGARCASASLVSTVCASTPEEWGRPRGGPPTTLSTGYSAPWTRPGTWSPARGARRAATGSQVPRTLGWSLAARRPAIETAAVVAVTTVLARDAAADGVCYAVALARGAQRRQLVVPAHVTAHRAPALRKPMGHAGASRDRTPSPGP